MSAFCSFVLTLFTVMITLNESLSRGLHEKWTNKANEHTNVYGNYLAIVFEVYKIPAISAKLTAKCFDG